MDQRIRELEREWKASGDLSALNSLLAAFLRLRSLEEWELAAEGWRREDPHGDEDAAAYIQLLRSFIRTGGDLHRVHGLDESDVYVNIYEDFTARTSVGCAPSEISTVRHWLRNYYTQNNLLYSGRNVWDASLSQQVYDPPARFVVENSASPCFLMYPRDISRKADLYGINLGYYEENLVTPSILRRLCPINLHGNRDHYVSLQLVDSLGPQEPESEPQEPESEIRRLPHWINVYSTTRQRGGSEEGGWWYDVDDPITSIYVGKLPAERYGEGDSPLLQAYHGIGGYQIVGPVDEHMGIPSHLQHVLDFLNQLYRGVTQGDIYSARGGIYLTITLQTHPAVKDPFFRPYYC